MATEPQDSASQSSTITASHTPEAPNGGDDTKDQLALPEVSASPSSTITKLDVSTGQNVKLDHLGPMVVNKDGSLSRINNWAEMTAGERENVLRVLGRRNMLRREMLQGGSAIDEGKNDAK